MSRLDYPLEWEIGSRKLVLNNQRTEDGHMDAAAVRDGYYQVEAYDFSPLDYREQREAMHLQTGGDFGPANRTFRHISVRGTIVAPNAARLDDMEAAFLAAFDLEHALLDNPTEFGVGTFKHKSPTSISAPHVGTVVREGFYARPEGYPVTFDRRGSRGYVRSFLAQLVAAYPFRCLFPQEAINFGAAAGWSQSLPNWTPHLGGTSRLRMIVNLAGNGSGNFTISDGTRSLVLNLSSAGAGQLIIDMWNKQIYNAALTDAAYLRSSNIDSFWDVPPGGATCTLSNLTNISSAQAQYHQTRA